MGARQSVAQPPRGNQPRTQSTAVSNGHSAGPSAATQGTGPLSAGRYSGGSAALTQTSRSYSVPVSAQGPSGSGRNPAGNEDSSDSEAEPSGGPLSFSGIPSLEQLLGRPRPSNPSSSGAHPILRHPPSFPIAFRFFDIKCPVCNKTVPSDDAECHLVMCLTRPRITYNEDVLEEENGSECVICLEEMVQGDIIARLPCLCIYHKTCIDSWFSVKNTCPEHPGDDD